MTQKIELKEETTQLADKKTAQEIASEISSSWRFKGTPPLKPVLLFMGGFQGSGKTTVTELLSSEVDLAIVSADEIRFKLFERGWKYNEVFRETVNAARDALLFAALSTGQNTAMDQFVTRERIEVAQDLVKKSGKDYKSIFIFLDAPHDLLIDRVKRRKPFPGKYNGTVEELEADFKKRGYPEYALFDRVIDSSKKNPQQIAGEVKPFLVS